MKFYKFWIFKGFSYLFMICLLLGIVLFLPLETTLPENSTTTTMFKIFISFVIFAIQVLFIVDVVNGPRYKKIYYVQLKDLNIETFENLYLVRYRGKAFPIASCHTSWLKKDKIKVVEFYNRKKKLYSWFPKLPYMRNQ